MSFAAESQAVEPDNARCASWTFETPSATLAGSLVKVDNSSSSTLFDLDTSDVVTVPNVLFTTTSDPQTLWGSALPSSLTVDTLVITKALDNPSTPTVNETDTWLTTPNYNLSVTALIGHYFEAQIQGYAYRFVPANPPGTQLILEPFTLTFNGWLPQENETTTQPPFSFCSLYDDTECQIACTIDYDYCCSDCSQLPIPRTCYEDCMAEYASCLANCPSP